MVTAASAVDPPAHTATWGPRICPHTPPCPTAGKPDRLAAAVIARHPEQGWSLLCNGMILFEDGGTISPVATLCRRGPCAA